LSLKPQKEMKPFFAHKRPEVKTSKLCRCDNYWTCSS